MKNDGKVAGILLKRSAMVAATPSTSRKSPSCGFLVTTVAVKTAVIARVEPQTQEQAEQILSSLGMTASNLIKA